MELLCGNGGVFATAKLLGINIKSDQKVIEVVDRVDNSNVAVVNTYGSVHDESLDIAEDEEEEDNIVVEGEDEPETMEITPHIPMFDLGHFLYQPPYQPQTEQVEEEPIPAPPSVLQQHENEEQRWTRDCFSKFFFI